MQSFLHPSLPSPLAWHSPPLPGEQAATALENNLSNLESRLDAILAALEAREDPQTAATVANSNDPPKAADRGGQKDMSLDGANGDATKNEKDMA
ncbi:hypothetical protein IL306_008407 [Fusarium sp. DS 682]|nr:hypothetical protein IL306_008407 [Fusarium sp. DS 682]